MIKVSQMRFSGGKGIGFNGHRTGQADGVNPACDQYIHKTG